MNTVGLIDDTIRFALSIEDADGDTVRRRARILQFAQEIWDDVWLHFPWTWKKTSASVSISSGVGSLPADFGEIGRDGAVYSGTNELLPVPDQQIHEYVQWGGGREEYTYTVRGMAASGALQIRVATTAAQTLTVYYERRPPELQDIPATGVQPVSGGGIIANGEYTYRITFVNSDGETEAGVISADVTTTGTQQVQLYNIPFGPPGTTARKIYRTAVNGVSHYLLTTIADNTTFVYNDNIADASLGVAAPVVNTTLYGLERIPSTYHKRVMVPGLRYKVLEDIVDERAKSALALYQSGLQWMQARERPRREGSMRMPRAMIGSW